MPQRRKNISFSQQIAIDRTGDSYVYGGNWDPFNRRRGTDCSGCVVDELDAAINGTAMEWTRHGLSTENWRAPDMGGGADPHNGPFGTVQVPHPDLFPTDSAVRIALHHGPGGGVNSHMWCEVDQLRVETNGSRGTVLGASARDVMDTGYANNWWYLPGPIVNDGTPVPHQPSAVNPPQVGEPRDTLFADVSGWQVPVDDSYTAATYREDGQDWHYRVLSIRSNDGTYQDPHFAQNYQWCTRACDDGRLALFIVYVYWRANWQDTLATMQQMVQSQGGPHPKMVAMIDLESGGNPGGDQSAGVNGVYYGLARWLGDDRRVIGYANLRDERSMWQTKPEHIPMILAGYGSNPNDPSVFKIAHQYTDGGGYDAELPQGAPPFGKCDMNSADGLSPSQLANALGVGDPAQPAAVEPIPAPVALQVPGDGHAANPPAASRPVMLPAAVVPTVVPVVGYVGDVTGPGLTDRWGVTSADLGVPVVTPDGKLMSVFGDTFSGSAVGQGDWRSPVALVGSGDAGHPIQYAHAGGPDPDYARQLWPYVHDSYPWTDGGISTVIPSDVLVLEKTMYLHAIVNRGFPNVIWTGIWASTDNGASWQQMGPKATFPASLHHGYAQLWSWDYDPGDGWVYVVSTGFQRDKGMILCRVRPADIGDMSKYSGWGWANNQWAWDNEPTPITPPAETWGELTLRRLDAGKWILGGFLSSGYALGYRTIDSPIADLYAAEVQTPVVGTSWDAQDLPNSRVAQLYGGYVLPGSQLGVEGGVGLVVSQWDTDTGWPYRAMQFKATLNDTTATSTAQEVDQAVKPAAKAAGTPRVRQRQPTTTQARRRASNGVAQRSTR